MDDLNRLADICNYIDAHWTLGSAREVFPDERFNADEDWRDPTGPYNHIWHKFSICGGSSARLFQEMEPSLVRRLTTWVVCDEGDAGFFFAVAFFGVVYSSFSAHSLRSMYPHEKEARGRLWHLFSFVCGRNPTMFWSCLSSFDRGRFYDYFRSMAGVEQRLYWFV